MQRSPRRSLATAALLFATSPSLGWAQFWPQVEVAAGGGFVGTPGTAVASRPAVDCDANQCLAVDGQVDLFADSKRVWKPALATGVVLRWVFKDATTEKEKDQRFGVGIGGQMVFTPQLDGTRLLPAVTIHAGSKSTQLFIGLLFGSFDKVVFPNGAQSIRVGAEDQSNFIQPNADNGPGVFVGVVIDGAAVTQ